MRSYLSLGDKKRFIQWLHTTVMVGLTLLVAGSVFASTWQDNLNSPTQQNANAPINVSDAPQSKGSPSNPTPTGALTLNAGLFTNGLRVKELPAVFDETVQIKGGTPAAGDVLTSVDDQGNATWQAQSSSIQFNYYYVSGPQTAPWQALGERNSDGTPPTKLTYNNGIETSIPGTHAFCALAGYQSSADLSRGGGVNNRCRVYSKGNNNFVIYLYQTGPGAGTMCEAVCY